MQGGVARALGQSKDVRAVEPLIAALKSAVVSPGNRGVALGGVASALADVAGPRGRTSECGDEC